MADWYDARWIVEVKVLGKHWGTFLIGPYTERDKAQSKLERVETWLEREGVLGEADLRFLNRPSTRMDDLTEADAL